MILDRRDQRRLAGGEGEAARIAIRLVAETGQALGAERLIPIASAHVAGCFYAGRVGLDFAARLVSAGARVAVPTTLNTGAIDLVHPELNRGDRETIGRARRLMGLYAAIGCRPTRTCAPYQVGVRPARGQDVAWGESNAVVFANSVLGARTNRHGDFIDIAAAITGRVPDTGLHRDANRRGEIVFELRGVPARLLTDDVLYPVLGHLVGRETGTAVPVIAGLPDDAAEHQLKALAAAAAASAGVALFHAVGLTPEAPTLSAALGGRPPARTVEVTPARLARARDSLSTASPHRRLTTVCLGTPHFSLAEFDQLTPLVADLTLHPGVEFYVSTSRPVLARLRERGELARHQRAGIRLVVDTCTHFPGVLRTDELCVMTNSAKWAYYAPGNLAVEVIFASLKECVRSASEGHVWRDERHWH